MNNQFLYNPEFAIDRIRQGDWEAVVTAITENYMNHYNLEEERIPEGDDEEGTQ